MRVPEECCCCMHVMQIVVEGKRFRVSDVAQSFSDPSLACDNNAEAHLGSPEKGGTKFRQKGR